MKTLVGRTPRAARSKRRVQRRNLVSKAFGWHKPPSCLLRASEVVAARQPPPTDFFLKPRCKMKTILAIILLTATTTPAEGIETNYAAYGQFIVTPFTSAPFPHPARTNGHTYQNKSYTAVEHYSDSTVAIFVPKSFRETGTVDFVVHFHGWHNSVAGTLSQFRLIEQLVASGKNAVLIVPEGPHNAPDSFGGKLEDTNGFKTFMHEAAETLRHGARLQQTNFALGNIILSGHSGGYHVMSAIVNRGGLPVKEVWLFDALYGGTENFLSWSDAQPGRLLDIYTDYGGTTNETGRLMKRLKDRGTSFLATEDSKAPPAELRTNRWIFLHTDLTHNDVIEKRKTFTQFLETSCLQDASRALAE